MKKLLLIPVLIAGLSGCASGGFGTMDRVMSSWEGASVDEVIQQWGYPHEERTIAGRTLLVWNRNTQITMPAVASTTGTVNNIGRQTHVNATTIYSGGGTSNWNCTRIFEVKENRLVRWQWEGNNCPFADIGPYSNWARKP